MAVLFDLDETLFNRTGSLKLFLSNQFTQRCSSIFPELAPVINRFLELDNRGRTPKHDVYSNLLAEHGVKDEELACELTNDYEQNAWRFALPFSGMSEMFHEIKSLGLKTGIVSNGQTHIQMRSLFALNLDRIVDVYLISETVNLKKPDPAIFLLAARMLSVIPSNCIFVGDSPEADIIGAKQVGMKAIWFPNGAQWPERVVGKPDAIIHSLKELCSLLRSLNDAS